MFDLPALHDDDEDDDDFEPRVLTVRGVERALYEHRRDA